MSSSCLGQPPLTGSTWAQHCSLPSPAAGTVPLRVWPQCLAHRRPRGVSAPGEAGAPQCFLPSFDKGVAFSHLCTLCCTHTGRQQQLNQVIIMPQTTSFSLGCFQPTCVSGSLPDSSLGRTIKTKHGWCTWLLGRKDLSVSSVYRHNCPPASPSLCTQIAVPDGPPDSSCTLYQSQRNSGTSDWGQKLITSSVFS